MFNIVLVNPQIPQNTGSIGRMCVNVDTILHIIKPVPFCLDEKSVRRAGLDYWFKLDPKIWESVDDFLAQNLKHKERFFFATTRGQKYYFDADFTPGDFIFFGAETTGLPQEIMQINPQNKIKIPMGKNGRSLNLATSVGIVTYEAIRQNFEYFSKVAL